MEGAIPPMLKLIGFIVAAMPVIMFVRAVLMGSKRRSQAVSKFKKQVDEAVWIILAVIVVAVILALAKLIFFDLGTAPPR